MVSWFKKKGEILGESYDGMLILKKIGESLEQYNVMIVFDIY